MAPRRSAAETRAVVVAAARSRFAAEGYDRATVRTIAADAGVDPAVVIRRFGSKAELFAESARLVLDLPDLAGLDASVAGERLARHFFSVWEVDETFQALLRVAATHDSATARMREVFARQVAPVVASVAPDLHPERASLVASQVVGLAFVRYVARVEPLATMGRDELAGWLAPVLAHYLGAPAPVLRTARP